MGQRDRCEPALRLGSVEGISGQTCFVAEPLPVVFCSGMLPFAAAAAALRETVSEECDPVHSYNDSHRDDCGTDAPSEQSETESAKDSEPGVRSLSLIHI